MNSNFEQDYKDIIRDIISYGTKDRNRTGVDTLVLPNLSITFSSGYDQLVPLITGKKVFYSKALAEFEWIYQGMTNVDYLNKHNIKWWNEYADENGELGKTYGYQLRKYNGYFDQLRYVEKEIIKGSRRAHATFWNPAELEETALPCCYTGVTFVLTNDSKILNASIQFRSSDVFLGLPYDFIFGYRLLKEVANSTNKVVGSITYNLANAHIYENHIEQCAKYLSLSHYNLPTEKQVALKQYIQGPYLDAKMNN